MSPIFKRFQWLQSAAAGIAALGLILPSGALAADAMPAGMPVAARQSLQILDVGLDEGGILIGQVVDAQGVPLPATVVALRSTAGQVANCYTDQNGRFQIRGLAGGLYEVTAAQRSGIFRLWTAGASPPSAVNQVLLVAGQPVARGQITVRGPQGGQWFGGTGALIGGTIILGSLAGVIAGGIITGLQQPPTTISTSAQESSS